MFSQESWPLMLSLLILRVENLIISLASFEKASRNKGGNHHQAFSLVRLARHVIDSRPLTEFLGWFAVKFELAWLWQDKDFLKKKKTYLDSPQRHSLSYFTSFQIRPNDSCIKIHSSKCSITLASLNAFRVGYAYNKLYSSSARLGCITPYIW